MQDRSTKVSMWPMVKVQNSLIFYFEPNMLPGDQSSLKKCTDMKFHVDVWFIRRGQYFSKIKTCQSLQNNFVNASRFSQDFFWIVSEFCGLRWQIFFSTIFTANKSTTNLNIIDKKSRILTHTMYFWLLPKYLCTNR